MNPPSPRSKIRSAAEVHIPFHLIGPLHNPQYDSYQMISPTNIHASETEVQASDPYSNISLLPFETYINALANIYSSPTSKTFSYYDTSRPSDTWASQTPAGLGVDPHLAGAFYSPPIFAHCISIQSTTSSDRPNATSFHALQYNGGPEIQADSSTPWWCNPWPSTGNGDETTLSSRVLKTESSTTHERNPENTSVSDAREDGIEHESRTDSINPSPPRKKKKSDGSGLYRETSINSNASALTIDLPSYSDSATTPMPLYPDMSFDSADAEARKNPRRIRSSRAAGSRSDTPRSRRPPTPATTRPEQRARNRIAAKKCRTKTKAAVAELEATAKQESLRHEQLSMKARGLQAEVLALKSEILMHGACGDGLIREYLIGSARALATGCGGVAEWGPGRVSHIPNSGPMCLRS